MIQLPSDYANLKDSDFPITIGGIEYKTKQDLADRYEADLMALAQLLYDIWLEKRTGID
jgi:hypothetical protein